MRRLIPVVVLMVLGGLSGCGGSDAPDPGLPKRAEATRAAAVKVFSQIGDALQVTSYTSTGGGRWEICGMLPSPSGAEYVAEVGITGAEAASTEYPEIIEATLTSAGWKVAQRTSEVIEASKDGLQLRARYGRAGINVSMTGGCIDASGNVIDKLTDEPRDDLGLPPPS